MLLKKTASKPQALHLSAVPHGNIPLWPGQAAWDILCEPKNQLPLFIHHNSATDNPIYRSNTESDFEHAENGIISNISM
jgi:hypothetical protein